MQDFAVDSGIGSYRITKETVSFAPLKACNVIRASGRERCRLSLQVYELGNKPRGQGLGKVFPSVESLLLGHSVWKGLYIMVVFSSLYIHFINARILSSHVAFSISLNLAGLSSCALVLRELAERGKFIPRLKTSNAIHTISSI